MADERRLSAPLDAFASPAGFFNAVSDAFDAASAAGRTTRSMAIAGLPLQLHIAGEPTTSMDRYLSGLIANPAAAGQRSGEAVLNLSIWDAKQTGVEPPAPDWRSSDHTVRGELPLFSDGRFLFGYNLQSRVLSAIDMDRRLAFQCFRSLDRLPQYEWGAPLRDVLGWWLASQGRPLLHSSAVSAFGAAALLVGPGGSGKSTTAALCLEHDALRFMADDYSAADPGSAQPQLHAVFSTSKLTPDSMGVAPASVQGEFSAESGKFLIRHGPGRIVSNAPLVSILLPRLTGEARSDMTPAGPGEALRCLAPSTLFQLPGSGPRELALMSSLVRRVPAYRLNLGRDRKQLLDLLAEHMLAAR